MKLCVLYLQVCSFQRYRLDLHADEEATGWGYIWLIWLVHKGFVATRIVCVSSALNSLKHIQESESEQLT